MWGGEICLDVDLVDIWGIRNPDRRLFTWKQTKPWIQRRLYFWLISDICQDEVEQVKNYSPYEIRGFSLQAR